MGVSADGVCGYESRARGPWARRVGGRRPQGRREAPPSAEASTKVARGGGARGAQSGESGRSGENPLRNALCARARANRASKRGCEPPAASEDGGIRSSKDEERSQLGWWEREEGKSFVCKYDLSTDGYCSFSFKKQIAATRNHTAERGRLRPFCVRWMTASEWLAF